MIGPKSMAVRHRRRHRQNRNCRRRRRAYESLLEFDQDLLLSKECNALDGTLVVNATQPYRSIGLQRTTPSVL
jgi:hypothetical protein